ncbi:MAG: hypothetical protein IJH07_04175 [Ruminococcus sp.]|nr:hypothetical protein [Ruminococcus sp.]
MKITRHSLMAKGILVLLSLLIIIFVFTFSWFTPPIEDNYASGVSMKTKAGSDFEYAIGFQTSQTGGRYLVTDFTSMGEEEWDIEHLEVDGYENTFNLIYDYNPIDITGDGVTLIRPNMEYGNWKINTGTDDYSIAEANTQYISFDIIVRSKSRSMLSLGPQSYAVGDCEKTIVNNETVDVPDGSQLIGASVTRKSDYGNFSKDAIVGAVRVAFIGFDDDGSITADSLMQDLQNDKLADTPSLLWVPRPDLYLNNNNRDQEVTGWSLNTGVASTDTFNLQSSAMTDSAYSTYRHQQYDIFNNTNNSVVTNNSSYVRISSKDANDNCYRFNDNVSLFPITYEKTVTENNQSVTYYYGKTRVRIWVEGTDTESRRALAGGKFRFNFDLTTNG